jgi:transcriptional regulator with XRE-family HTH domain
MVDLGQRLKDLRKEHGLTQQQVADRVWVSKAMISSYELSARAPSYEVLIKLSKLFGVTTDYLLGVESKRIIDARGLSDKQVGLITALIEEMTKNNGS